MSHWAAKAAGVIEDVQFLLDMGESPTAICSRIDRKPEAVARLLHRRGRTDLARMFWRVVKQSP